jgi:hypothetical protein
LLDDFWHFLAGQRCDSAAGGGPERPHSTQDVPLRAVCPMR